MTKRFSLLFIGPVVILLACNSNPSSSNLNSKIDSLQTTNDSLKKLLNNSKSADDPRLAERVEVKTTKQMIIGNWSLQFDKYDFNTLSKEDKNYFSQLKNAVSSFNFIFNKDMTMSITSELRGKEKETSKIDGVYRISKDNKRLEIERHSDEIVLDEAVQKYAIKSIDGQNMILKSGTLEYIMRKQ